MTTITFDRSFSGSTVASDNIGNSATEKNKQSAKATLFQFTGIDGFNDNQKARLSQLAVPAEGGEEISFAAAAEALDRILQALGGGKQSNGTNSNPAMSMDLSTLESIPMNSMFAASSLLAGQILGDVASKKGEMLDIFSLKQDKLRREEVENIREQMQNAIEQQDKAKKAGIIGVICDWVIAAVEVVTGVAKIIGGALSGNAMMVAGGAMDTLAGMAGIGKAVCNTMALIDPDNAEKYHSMAEKFGIAQMSFEIAGAAIDITSALRNAIVTKVIPKVAGKVAQEASGEALNQAIKQGSKSGAKEAAKQIGKEVASQTAEQVTRKLGEAMSKKTTDKILATFTQQAIETMVTKSAEKVAKKAIKEGVELTTEQLAKQISSQVQKDVLKAVAKSAFLSTGSVLQTTRGVVNGAQQIAMGDLEKQKAKLQKEMGQLMLDQQWIQNLFQFFDQEKKETVKRVRELQEDRANIQQDATQTISQTASSQAQMASSMV